MKSLTVVALILVFPFISYSAIIYVPDDYQTIQEAIDYSFNGDTIIVRNGTYFENINFNGKAVTVRGETKPEDTTIDGSSTGCVVTFSNDEGSNSQLIGFTITNGSGSNGGGVYSNGTPTIEQCIIRSNSAAYGGGLYIDYTTGEMILDTCVIEQNKSTKNGAGIWSSVNDGSLVLKGCDLIGNKANESQSADAHGGGILFASGSLSLVDCNVSYNVSYSGTTHGGDTSYSYGGGIYGKENINIRDCIFEGNKAWAVDKHSYGTEDNVSYGGGFYLHSGSLKVTNCLLFKNGCNPSGSHPHPLGSGFFINSGTANIKNCTVAHNESKYALYRNSGTVTVTDSIIYFNNGEISGTVTVNYCDVEGVYTGNGNLYDDPLFFKKPGSVEDFHNYYLSQKPQIVDSPCIDVGSTLAFNLGVHTCSTATVGTLDSGAVDMGFHYGSSAPYEGVTLKADVYEVSATTGGTANFTLSAGEENKSRYYMLLGSMSDTEPGTPLPGGKVTLPLNWDMFTSVICVLFNTQAFQDFVAPLTIQGTHSAQFNVPANALFPGITFSFAYALAYPWDAVSNPWKINIVP